MSRYESEILSYQDDGCTAAPDQPALICGATTMSHQALRSRSARLASALHSLGLEPGARVAVCAANCHRMVELYLAVPAAGFVFVPIDPRLAPAELRSILELCTPAVLFTDGTIDPDPLADLVPLRLTLSTGYEALLATAEPAIAPSPVTSSRVAALFFTGGTTGRPKAVMLTHGNLIANARHYAQCAPFHRDTRWLIAAPMSHVSGTMAVLATIRAGGCSVVLQSTDPGDALDAIIEHRVTGTLMVPSRLAELADRQNADPRAVRSLQCITHGAAPITSRTLARAARAFPDVELVHLYGATETGPIAAAFRDEQSSLRTARAGSCGRGVEGVRIAIVNESGLPVPARTVGEITIGGPNVMAGYWQAPELTASVLDEHRAYRTGDMGYLDEDGYLFVVDRLKDVIVRAGQNVYSAEIEAVLSTHPAIIDVAVFAVPDAELGEAVCAAVVVGRSQITERQVRAYCAGRLADYKVPTQVELRQQRLPRSRVGKVDKRTLRAPYWAMQGAPIGAC